ncbi:MAG: DUF721 domain-containing protein [Alphaproteobacteria bacterium]|nr:DUF721 domain-containing protein [Alphaproteobacteria bacterium]
MRPISESTARIVKKSFSRKYIALGRIVNNWEEIVGQQLADKAQPVKIHYHKREKSQAPDATLDIAVSTANATLLHYQKDLILERINQVFGEQWITGIRFVNIPSNEEVILRKRSKRTLSASEQESLANMVASIADGDIKERLNRLGTEILTSD